MSLRHSLFFTAPRQVEIIASSVPQPGPEEVVVQSVCSAISAGTELLAYRGQLPAGIPLDDSIASLSDSTRYPMKYGYSIVGQVIDVGEKVSRSEIGRNVYVFNPHESHFVALKKNLIYIPDDVHLEDMVFLANVETAISLVLDGRPLLGERVLVLGLGVVGQLLASVLKMHPLAKLALVDPLLKRRITAKTTSMNNVVVPEIYESLDEDMKGQYDLVYETSGSPEALNAAIQYTGYHGRLIVASWYGSKGSSLDLGTYFHRSKMTIYASQVSNIDPSLMGRWDKKRRMATAIEMLKKMKPRQLITHQFSIDKSEEAYKLIDTTKDSIQTVITY